MNNFKNISFLTLLGVLALFSCKKEDDVLDDHHDEDHEEEVITTLNYTLISENGEDTVLFKFSDADGNGGNNPVITSDRLLANTIYSGTLELLNESESPAHNITEEIQEEADEHQFFFDVNNASAAVTYADKDVNDLPIGLLTNLVTDSISTGTLTVILRHQPNKSAAGVSNGDITNAGGETDIEVNFAINVE